MAVPDQRISKATLPCKSVQLSQSKLQYLHKFGWVSVCGIAPEELPNVVKSVATTLGHIVKGRGGRLLETLRPQTCDEAPHASLSAKFGLDALPFHIDCSHWAVPCRYIVLGCSEGAPQRVPTLLADREAIRLDSCERRLARSSVFHISNGRNSFYASIFGIDPRFIRYDPGCMKPTSESARAALLLFASNRLAPQSRRHVSHRQLANTSRPRPST